MNKLVFYGIIFSVLLLGCTPINDSHSNEGDAITLQVGYVENLFDPTSFNSTLLVETYQTEYDKTLSIEFQGFSNSMVMLEALQDSNHSLDMVIAEDFLLADLYRQLKLVAFDREPISGGGNFTYIENVSDNESYFFKRYWNRTFFSDKKLFDWIIPFDFSTYGVLYKPFIQETIHEGKTTLEHLLIDENRTFLHVKGSVTDTFLHHQWADNPQDRIQLDDALNQPLYQSRYWQEQYSLRGPEENQLFQNYLISLTESFDLSMLHDENARFIKTSDYLRFVKPEVNQQSLPIYFSSSPEINVLSFQGIGLLNESKKEPLQLLINALMDPIHLIQHSQVHKTGLFLSRTPLQVFFTSLEDPLAPSENPPLINLSHYLKRNVFDGTTYQFKWAVNNDWRLIYIPESRLDQSFGLLHLTLTFPNLTQIWNLETLQTEGEVMNWIIPLVIILIALGMTMYVVLRFRSKKSNFIPLKPYKLMKLKKKYEKNPKRYEKELQRLSKD